MRSADDVKRDQLAMLSAMFLRPSMYGTSGQSLEQLIRLTLKLLAFIDERDAELSHAFSTLENAGFSSPLGTAGALAAALGGGLDRTDEVAAVLARIASQLGYFSVENRVSDSRWRELERLRTWPADWPRTPSTIEAHLGVPSYRGAGTQARVFAYAGSGDEAWLLLVLSASEPCELECVILPRYPLGDSVIDLRPRAITASPEEVYRRFLIATVDGDVATLRTLLVQRTDALPFFEKPYPREVAPALIAMYRSMDVFEVSPPDATVHLISDACPVPLALVKDGASWRVDAEPLIRFRADRASD